MATFKMIHTGDWHIGKSLEKTDRTEEQEALLTQLTTLCHAEQPDALLICGDIYDNATPQFENQTFFNHCMEQLYKSCPSMTIVAISGNHDGQRKLKVERNLLRYINVHIINEPASTPDGQADYAAQVVTITGSDGQPKALIGAMPFCYPQNLPTTADDGQTDGQNDSTDRTAAYLRGLAMHLKQINTSHLPAVLMAHIALGHCNHQGNETSNDTQTGREYIGGMATIETQQLGSGYQYLALGHIHQPQTMRLKDGLIARYAGSPLAVSFDEDYPHSVTVVQFEGDRLIENHQVEIKNPVPLITLPHQPAAFDKALAELKKFPEEQKAKIRLNITSPDTVPNDYSEQIDKATCDKLCRCIKLRYSEVSVCNPDAIEEISTEAFRQMTPMELAERYYQYKHPDDEMDENIKKCLTEVIDEITKEEQA